MLTPDHIETLLALPIDSVNQKSRMRLVSVHVLGAVAIIAYRTLRRPKAFDLVEIFAGIFFAIEKSTSVTCHTGHVSA